MNNSVILIGNGSILKSTIDIFNSNDVLIYGILDDTEESEIENIAVLGKPDEKKYLDIIGQETAVSVAIENALERAKVVKMLLKSYKVMPINAIHNLAYISGSSSLGHGNILAAGSSIEGFTTIGNHNVIKNRVAIGVGATIADFVEISSGAIINEAVSVEDGAFIGSGAIVVAGVTIGKNARVGAGSVVIDDVAAKATVFGNPAKQI